MGRAEEPCLCSRTLWGTEMSILLRRDAQMSVEAAVLIPAALMLIALLAQPACVLYTRSVMAATAGDLARLVVTSQDGEEELRDYALRRLAAVPDVPIFHVGGPAAWRVSCAGPDDTGRVTVSLEGRVRPLPLFGAIVLALGTVEGGDVVIRVERSEDLRAEWIGGSYEDWLDMWG